MSHRLSFYTFLLLYACFLWTGYRGMDYGKHWDEQITLESLHRPFLTGTLLPQQYYYPSLGFNLGMIALLPEWCDFVYGYFSAKSNPKYLASYEEFTTNREHFKDLNGAIWSHSFLLRLRCVYFTLSSLTALWVLLTIYLWTQKKSCALLGAAMILTSWEFAYHARWIAYDTLQTHFIALTLLWLSLALHRESPIVWLRLSALGASLCCATKYHGGILLFSVLATAILLAQKHKNIFWKKEIGILLGTFVGGLYLFCPGIFLQPFHFFDHLLYQIRIYDQGHNSAYIVGRVTEHSWLILRYLGQVLFSPWDGIALLFFTLAIAGGIRMLIRSPKEMSVILIAPIGYFLYMMTNALMTTRNYLFFAPYLALFTAYGFSQWIDASPSKKKMWTVVSLLMCCFAFNLGWLFWTAEGIHHKDDCIPGEEIEKYLLQHPQTKFLLSPWVRQTLSASTQNKFFLNVVSHPEEADFYLFYSKDVEQFSSKWRANIPNRYQLVSGTYEVNMDYYPTWVGQGKVLAISIKEALIWTLLK